MEGVNTVLPVVQNVNEAFCFEFQKEIRNDFHPWQDDLQATSLKVSMDIWQHEENLIYKPVTIIHN